MLERFFLRKDWKETKKDMYELMRDSHLKHQVRKRVAD